MQNEESKKSAVFEMCRMWIVMECEYPEGSEQKIYLPAVLVPKEKNKKTSLRGIIMSLAKRAKKPILKALSGVAAGLLVAMWIVPEVTAQRGYSAIGGEYLLIILAVFMAIHIADRLIEKR